MRVYNKAITADRQKPRPLKSDVGIYEKNLYFNCFIFSRRLDLDYSKSSSIQFHRRFPVVRFNSFGAIGPPEKGKRKGKAVLCHCENKKGMGSGEVHS